VSLFPAWCVFATVTTTEFTCKFLLSLNVLNLKTKQQQRQRQQQQEQEQEQEQEKNEPLAPVKFSFFLRFN